MYRGPGTAKVCSPPASYTKQSYDEGAKDLEQPSLFVSGSELSIQTRAPPDQEAPDQEALNQEAPNQENSQGNKEQAVQLILQGAHANSTRPIFPNISEDSQAGERPEDRGPVLKLRGDSVAVDDANRSAIGDIQIIRECSQLTSPESQAEADPKMPREDKSDQNHQYGKPDDETHGIPHCFVEYPTTTQRTLREHTSGTARQLASPALSPTRRDFATFPTSLHLLTRASCLDSSETVASLPAGLMDADNDASMANKSSHLRHRRRMAATRINTGDIEPISVKHDSGCIVEHSASADELAILSPEPISPARGLKVKDSIPQLIKALPPLPSDFRECQETPDRPVVGPHLVEKIGQGEVMSAERQPVLDGQWIQSSKDGQLKDQRSPTKFKIRVKPPASPSHCPGAANAGEDQPPKASSPEAVLQTRPKLKLKLSRSQLSRGGSSSGDAFEHITRLKQCNSLADLAMCSNATRAVLDDNSTAPRCPQNHVQTTGIFQDQHGMADLSAEAPESTPASPDDDGRNEHSVRPSNTINLVQVGRQSSEAASYEDERGLRKKFSMLRLRIAESLTMNQAKKRGKLELQSGDGHSTNLPLKDCSAKAQCGDNTAGKHVRNSRSEWMVDRMRQWATEAKKAVHSYVRRTLDRSPHRTA